MSPDTERTTNNRAKTKCVLGFAAPVACKPFLENSTLDLLGLLTGLEIRPKLFPFMLRPDEQMSLRSPGRLHTRQQRAPTGRTCYPHPLRPSG